MADLNFNEERISFTPIVLFTEYINLQFNKYLKTNFDDITPVDFMYLVNIFYHQNISQRQLADLLFVSESNVAQIIKRLENKGLISRIPDENNKSRKILNLTEKSKLIVFTLIKEIYEHEILFFEQYSKDEEIKFKNMLYDFSNKSINP